MRPALSFLGAVLLSWAVSPAVTAQQFHMERNLDRNLADARLLRNIEPVQSATASLLRLRPVRYQVQSPVSGALLGPLRLGFVAQQLHTVYPGMVLRDYDAKGTLRVEYGEQGGWDGDPRKLPRVWGLGQWACRFPNLFRAS